MDLETEEQGFEMFAVKVRKYILYRGNETVLQPFKCGR